MSLFTGLIRLIPASTAEKIITASVSIAISAIDAMPSTSLDERKFNMRLFDQIVNLRDEVIGYNAEFASKLTTATDLLRADDWLGCRILLEMTAKRGDDSIRYDLASILSDARKLLVIDRL